MNMMRLLMVGMLVATLAIPAMAQDEEAAPAAGGKDTVKKTSGEQLLHVNVTAETYETITVDGKTIPTSEVETIIHGDRPPKYIQAESNFRQFQLENAIKNFEEAKSAPARPWLKHYCDYYIGKCYQMLAEAAPTMQERQSWVSQAVAKFDALIKENPKGFWVPHAMAALGQCYYSLGDFAKALAVYQQIEKANMGVTWTLRAQLWAGKILTAQNQVDQAIAALSKVMETAKEKSTEIYYDAQIALAEAYIRAQKFKEAEDMLKKLIETNEKDEVRAVAHNTLGDCYKAQNKVKEARLEYLRTNVLYFKVKDQDARALYSAAECFELLKDKERADRLREELKRNYPDSPWARALAAGGQ